MSEVIAEGAAVESGGPPVETEAAESFTDLDGSKVEVPKPTPKPRASRRAAAPAPESEEAEPKAAAPAAEPAKEPPQMPQAPKGVEALRRPGEADSEFYPRLHQEQRARAHKAEERAERYESGMQAAISEIQRLQKLVEPVLQKQWKEAHDAEREATLAAIPDEETDPDAYQRWLTKQNTRLILEERKVREDRERAQEEERTRMQAQERHLAALADRDENLRVNIESMLGDETVARAYHASLYATSQQFAQVYPDATDDQIEELTLGAHMLELIDLQKKGISPAAYYGSQAEILRRAAAMMAGNGGNGGNGHAAPAMATAPTAAPEMGSPTAARVQKEAARAAAAAAVSTGGSPGRPGGIPGQSLNPALYETEEDFVRAGMKGDFDPEEWTRGLAKGRRG